MGFFWFIVFIFIIYVVLKRISPRKGGKVETSPSSVPAEEELLPYTKKRYFFSIAERRFYAALKQVADKNNWVIFPKVRLRDVFNIYSRRYSREMFINNSKIVQKHVDFLLCETNDFSPIVGIELDDSSHNTPNRIERDGFVDRVFDSADLPILRVRVLPDYDLDVLERGLLKNTGIKNKKSVDQVVEDLEL